MTFRTHVDLVAHTRRASNAHEVRRADVRFSETRMTERVVSCRSPNATRGQEKTFDVESRSGHLGSSVSCARRASCGGALCHRSTKATRMPIKWYSAIDPTGVASQSLGLRNYYAQRVPGSKRKSYNSRGLRESGRRWATPYSQKGFNPRTRIRRKQYSWRIQMRRVVLRSLIVCGAALIGAQVHAQARHLYCALLLRHLSSLYHSALYWRSLRYFPVPKI